MGFEADRNEVVLVTSTGETDSRCRARLKREIADRIFDEVLSLRLALHAADGRMISFANIWSSTATSA